jgi:hypothetical protein
MSKHRDIPADGFLAEPWPALKRRIREGERGRMFAFCEEMNRYGMKLACDLRARRSVPAEIYGLLFYLKALYSFQGAILLLSRGMPVESEVLSRTGLECAIVLGAIEKDPSHIDALIDAHNLHLETQARSVRDLLAGETTEAFGPTLGKAIDTAASQPKAKDTHKLAQTAEKADMRAEFDIFYRGASGAAAHATLGAAMRHLREEGGVFKVTIGPNYELIPRSFASAVVSLVPCFRHIGRIFGRNDVEEAGKRFNERWGEIIGPLDQQVARR